MEATAAPVKAHMAPIVSTSRFDAHAGQFLDEEFSSLVRFENVRGEEVSVTINVRRQFFPPEERVADVVNTGDYVFMFNDNGKPHARTLAGVNADDTSESMDKVLAVQIHHGWTDTNNDGAPVPDELSDRTTQFDAGEPVKFALIAFGLQNENVHLDFVAADGRRLVASNIPINASYVWANRWIDPAPEPGVYFSQFFVNDRHLVRVPVQVFPDSGQPGAAPIQVDEDTLRRAIASILALRGTIQPSANRSVLEVTLRDSRVSDEDLKRLKERSVLQTLSNAARSPISLDLCATSVTDAGLEHLKGLTNLRVLGLGQTRVTDGGLEHLKVLTSLRTLDLSGARVTVAGVQELKAALPNCKIKIER